MAVPGLSSTKEGASPAATPGDHSAQSGTVTFQSGRTSAAITVAVRGDTEPEPDEFVLISFAARGSDVTMGRFFGLAVVEVSNDD